jgi:hypothetical protein
MKYEEKSEKEERGMESKLICGFNNLMPLISLKFNLQQNVITTCFNEIVLWRKNVREEKA